MKKILGSLFVLLVLCAGLFTFIQNSYAAGGATAPLVDAKLQNPIKYDNFSDFVAAVLQTAVEILMPFVVLAFIWSGFLFVRAQGNEKQLEDAKAAIKWSIVGAFILMGAWGFAQIISTTISTLTQ
jgi:nucleoside recognition membrane protein YjiH